MTQRLLPLPPAITVAPLPPVRLPNVVTAPGTPPTVDVPLPDLPLLDPTVRSCVLLACVRVGH